MYCVVIHVLAKTDGSICASSDYMVAEVTLPELERLKREALDGYVKYGMDSSHKREWFYGSVHNIFQV